MEETRRITVPTKTRLDTRERILDAAEQLILARGFVATPIDRIIEEVGLTKGAFFHHFRSKGALAQALIERYARTEQDLLHSLLDRATRLSSDPVQQLLIFVGLFLEIAEATEEPSPGCLFASYCYESGQFDAATMQIVADSILMWRAVLSERIRAAAAHHPPRADIDVGSLADMFTGLLEGAFIISRTLQDPRVFAQQLRHYRQYLALLFGA
jgi:TetR/AcrR family transcriptional regulator, transcriptional repressor for nem operon